MGLDITSIARLTPAKCDKRDDCDHERLYVNADFAGRSEPFDTGCYTTDDADAFGFRAGSYGGYSRWRDTLAKIAGYPAADPEEFDDPSYVRNYPHAASAWNEEATKDKPFYELIYFSDCEGVIGPVVSKKLAADFAAHDDMMRAAMEDYDYQKYSEWRKAFEHASDNGAVLFH